jgi:cell division protein FtsN
MQYIFGDEEEQGTDNAPEHGGSQSFQNGFTDEASAEPRKLAKAAKGAGKPSVLPETTGAAVSRTPVLAKVREELNVSDNRRRLLIWAVGFVSVAIGFVAVTSRTGDQGVTVPDAPVVASSPKGKTPEPVKPAPGKAQEEGADVPSSAVRSSNLVVKRKEGEAAGVPAVAGPSAADKPADAAPANAPKSPPADVKAVTGDAAPVPAAPPAPTVVAAPPLPPAPAASQPSPPPGTPATPTVTPPAVASSPSPPGPVPGPATLPPAQTVVLAPSAPSAPPPSAASVPGDRKPQAPPLATPPARTAESAAPAAPAKAASAAKPAGKQVASLAPPATGAKYTVQIGAFKSRENAEALLARVQRSYPDGRVIATDGGVYRVVSGAFATKDDAASRAHTLTANGFSAYVRDMPR